MRLESAGVAKLKAKSSKVLFSSSQTTCRNFTGLLCLKCLVLRLVFHLLNFAVQRQFETHTHTHTLSHARALTHAHYESARASVVADQVTWGLAFRFVAELAIFSAFLPLLEAGSWPWRRTAFFLRRRGSLTRRQRPIAERAVTSNGLSLSLRWVLLGWHGEPVGTGRNSLSCGSHRRAGPWRSWGNVKHMATLWGTSS